KTDSVVHLLLPKSPLVSHVISESLRCDERMRVHLSRPGEIRLKSCTQPDWPERRWLTRRDDLALVRIRWCRQIRDPCQGFGTVVEKHRANTTGLCLTDIKQPLVYGEQAREASRVDAHLS